MNPHAVVVGFFFVFFVWQVTGDFIHMTNASSGDLKWNLYSPPGAYTAHISYWILLTWNTINGPEWSQHPNRPYCSQV